MTAVPLCAACGAGVFCFVHDQPAADPQPGSTPVRVDDEVRDLLARLDGSPESAVALLAGVPRDQLGEYGGMGSGGAGR